jgi:hypothetical protein
MLSLVTLDRSTSRDVASFRRDVDRSAGNQKETEVYLADHVVRRPPPETPNVEQDVSGNRASDELEAQLRELHESNRQHQQETSRRLKQIGENQARTWDALHELEMQILDQENAIRTRG